MNEQACAVVCWLLSLVCCVLSWYAARTDDWQCMVVTMVFAALVALLSAYTIAYKYL